MPPTCKPDPGPSGRRRQTVRKSQSYSFHHIILLYKSQNAGQVRPLRPEYQRQSLALAGVLFHDLYDPGIHRGDVRVLDMDDIADVKILAVAIHRRLDILDLQRRSIAVLRKFLRPSLPEVCLSRKVAGVDEPFPARKTAESRLLTNVDHHPIRCLALSRDHRDRRREVGALVIALDRAVAERRAQDDGVGTVDTLDDLEVEPPVVPGPPAAIPEPGRRADRL